MKLKIVAAFAVGCILAAAASPAALAAQGPPQAWDNLVLTSTKGRTAVYLLPGADFGAYHKVQIDPTEVAFQKDFVRTYNSSAGSLSRRLDASDVKRMTDQAQASFQEILVKAFSEGGFEVVTASGPDVLRLRTAVLDVTVTAPDVQSGRSRTFATDAGQATLVIEARDSETGAILGRAVDRRAAGDTGARQRDSISNRADFRRLFASWATRAVKGFRDLSTAGPAGSTSTTSN